MNNQNKLVLKLFEEFKQTFGLKENEEIHKHFNEFKNWLSIKRTYTSNYVNYLRCMSIDDNLGLIAELGKCEYNSTIPYLVKEGFNCVSITKDINPFSDALIPYYNAYLTIYKSEPMIIYPTTSEMRLNPNCHDLLNDEIRTFITQLPHDDKNEIDAMIKTANNHDVIIGAYGDIHDKNYDQKIKRCSNIRDILSSKSNIEVSSELFKGDDYDYYYVVKAKPKQLIKKITR